MHEWTELDLYNFVEPSADKSKYVLTSPRSLEACSILHIQPIDLLPKSLKEFSESLSSYSKDIDVLYKKFEIERLRKLNLCREERKKIIEKEFIGIKNVDQKPDLQGHSLSIKVATSHAASDLSFFEPIYTPRELGTTPILSRRSAFTVLSGSASEEENDGNSFQALKCTVGASPAHKSFPTPQKSIVLPTKDKHSVENFPNYLLDKNYIRSLSAGTRVAFQNEKDKEGREEKHKRLQEELEAKNAIAQDSFSRKMKEKQRKLIMQKLKEEERKLFQQQQIHLMQKDLKLWQDELIQFQNLNESRAHQVVAKKNAIKRQTALNNRLMKELDHAALKARIEQENKLREEEVKTAIILKNKRVQHINEEKDNFLKVSRDVARANRVLRDMKKEKDMQSSFDKMAANAEKMARIEKLSLRKTTPASVEKQKSNFVLG